jgi:cell division transport system permease protein
MQLVGATGFFIQRPFILRSSFHGFLGGIIAVILLASTLQYAQNLMPELILLHDAKLVFMMFGLMIISGVFICLFSTIFSMRRYLKMQLEDLY